jgi:hypothetical protein
MAGSRVKEYDVIDEEVVIKTTKKTTSCKCIKETRDISCEKHA